jgi:hypothetical protein
MKQLISVALFACLCVWAVPNAFASGKNPCENRYLKYIYNECSPHTVDTDTHRDAREDPIGVGADVLIHETEALDLVAEYKYDFENEEHSVFAVFKTKKSLVDYIKALFNRGE